MDQLQEKGATPSPAPRLWAVLLLLLGKMPRADPAALRVAEETTSPGCRWALPVLAWAVGVGLVHQTINASRST